MLLSFIGKSAMVSKLLKRQTVRAVDRLGGASKASVYQPVCGKPFGVSNDLCLGVSYISDILLIRSIKVAEL